MCISGKPRLSSVSSDNCRLKTTTSDHSLSRLGPRDDQPRRSSRLACQMPASTIRHMSCLEEHRHGRATYLHCGPASPVSRSKLIRHAQHRWPRPRLCHVAVAPSGPTTHSGTSSSIPRTAGSRILGKTAPQEVLNRGRETRFLPLRLEG